ncbi:MAG TPA: DUF4126 domain-containing protein [Thermoanaerobaculia bacterium]
MSPWELTLALLLGVGLSASTGLNTFLPLLLLSAAAKFHVAGITLNGSFGWLASDTAIIILIVACILEIIADKVPAVDHFLDAVGTFGRPIAGGLAMASVLDGADPVVAAVVGLIVGSPISLGFHTLKAGTRVASSAVTFGCANPVISIVEDIISLGLSVLAIFVPFLVPVAVLLLVWLLWKVGHRLAAAPAQPPQAMG